MPLQIKELHIKVNVNSENESETTATGAESSGAGLENSQNNDLLISECVEQVMEILKEKMEP